MKHDDRLLSKNIARLLSLCLLFLICFVPSDAISETSPEIEILSQACRNHSFSKLDFDILLVSSKSEYEKIFNSFKIPEDLVCMNSTVRFNLTRVLERSKLDFSTHSLLLKTSTLGSGSTKLSLGLEKEKNDNWVINLEKASPEMGTADVAYYLSLVKINKLISLDKIKLRESSTTTLSSSEVVETGSKEAYLSSLLTVK